MKKTRQDDVMLKKIFATLAVSAIPLITAPTFAQSETQSRKSPQYFLGDAFKGNPPNCLMYYPEPIGRMPGRSLSEDLCSPPPLAIIPRYGEDYAGLMRNGIRAGIRGDYDTALINFRRAELIEISKNYLGYRNREALRGINGARLAKRYKLYPHPVKRLTPQFFWYHWTGTGNRGNWGKLPRR